MKLSRSDAVRYVDHFAGVLLKTKFAARSNSVRHRLFMVLISTVRAYQHRLPLNVVNEINQVSAFDIDETRFRSVVELAVDSLKRSEYVTDIAETLHDEVVAARLRHIAERAAETAAEIVNLQNMEVAAKDFIEAIGR